jgi:predicted DsbA family dithiol-disulfide isomerase
MRFGGPGPLQALIARLRAVGAQEGINFAFGGNTGSTKDSHRLIYQVGKHYGGEKQTLVAKALFKSYFEKEENVTDKKVLLQAAVDSGAGLSEKEVKGWLDSDAGRAEVDREADEARANWIQGVPHFLIQGQYAVEGAEDPEQFLRVFKAVKNAE